MSGPQASPRVYHVVQLTLSYASVAEAAATDGERLAAHLAHSRALHERGDLLMAGAFLEARDGRLQTMAICVSEAAAREFLAGDPFVAAGAALEQDVRPWADMFAAPAPSGGG